MASRKKRRRNKVRSASGVTGRIWIPLTAALLTSAAVFFVFMLISGTRTDTSYEETSAPEIPEMNMYLQSNFRKKKGLLRYEDDIYTSRAGIDVSTYQKSIDFEKVKKAGIEFVMIRVGYRTTKTGKIHKDKRFEEYYKGASKAGLDIGAYFFSEAKNKREAKEEARFVIKNLKGKKISYPVAFDMEDTAHKDRHESLSIAERTVIADVFCQIISNNGYDPILYAYPDWIFKKIDYMKLTKYDMWLAHYTDHSQYPFHYLMWQYTEKGRVNGIEGKVDRDIMFIKK